MVTGARLEQYGRASRAPSGSTYVRAPQPASKGQTLRAGRPGKRDHVRFTKSGALLPGRVAGAV
eukprot:4725965-Alexandrium_andersonii.AAC.1